MQRHKYFLSATSVLDLTREVCICVCGADDMSLLSAHVLDNRRLTGVAFLPRGEVGVSAYDHDDLSLFVSD